MILYKSKINQVYKIILNKIETLIEKLFKFTKNIFQYYKIKKK